MESKNLLKTYFRFNKKLAVYVYSNKKHKMKLTMLILEFKC